MDEAPVSLVTIAMVAVVVMEKTDLVIDCSFRNSP
jgi:hypothetical protein